MSEYSVFDPVPGMLNALRLGKGIGDHLQEVKSNQTLRDMFAAGVDPYSADGMQQLGSVDPQMAMAAQAQGARIGALNAGARKDNWELANKRLGALIPQMLQAGEGKDVATKRQILASVYPEIQRVTPGAPSPDFRTMDDAQVEEAWQNAHMLQAHLSGQNPFAAKPVQRTDGQLEWYIQRGDQMIPTGQMAPKDFKFMKNEFGEFVRGDSHAGSMDVVNPGASGGMPMQPSGIGQPPPGVTTPAPAVVPGAAPTNASFGDMANLERLLKNPNLPERERQALQNQYNFMLRRSMNQRRQPAPMDVTESVSGQTDSVSAPVNTGGFVGLENKPAIQRKRMESQIDQERQMALEAEQQANREKNMQTEQDFKRTQTEREAELAINKEKFQDELVTTREARKDAPKNAANAEQGLQTLDVIDNYLSQATGSGIGAIRDGVADFFGYTTDGAEALASIKPLAAQLTSFVPRFEGSQSNIDVEFYKQQAGNLANEKTPPAQKAAASRAVRLLYLKSLGRYRDAKPDKNGFKIGDTKAWNGKVMIFDGEKWF